MEQLYISSCQQTCVPQYLPPGSPSHADRVKNDYFKDVPVNRPAMLPVNMFVAAAGILELLNRLHPYRSNPTESAQLMVDMTNTCLVPTPEDELDADEYLAHQVDLGTVAPFLVLLELQPICGGSTEFVPRGKRSGMCCEARFIGQKRWSQCPRWRNLSRRGSIWWARKQSHGRRLSFAPAAAAL